MVRGRASTPSVGGNVFLNWPMSAIEVRLFILDELVHFLAEDHDGEN